MLTAVYFEQFYSSKASEYTKLSDLMVFGNGKSRPKTNGTIPVYGGNGVLSYTDKYNAENTVLIGRVGAYCGSVYLEQSICWVSDNAIFAKSKFSGGWHSFYPKECRQRCIDKSDRGRNGYIDFA